MIKADFGKMLIQRLRDPEERARLILNAALAINLVYTLFKLIAGAWYHSWWMIALGAYYGLLAFTRFHLLRKLRLEDGASDWKAYRHTAVLLLGLTVVIGGIVELTFSMHQAFEYPSALIYVFSAFAFIKMISVSVSLIKKRHEDNRVLAAARCVSFAHALMSILALQVALIQRFGSENPRFALLMNSFLGGVTCIAIIGMASFMLWKSGKVLGSGKEAPA